jgi:hypothetical protein
LKGKSGEEAKIMEGYMRGRGLNIRFLWLTWCKLDGGEGVLCRKCLHRGCRRGSRVHFMFLVSDGISSYKKHVLLSFNFIFFNCVNRSTSEIHLNNTFVHSIGMCRVRKFLGVLRSFSRPLREIPNRVVFTKR